ncbi:hypothetical protein Q0V21_23745 [Paenibacillus sp. 11B]|uniref:hypothetical protein n=1 Tax=Paenibacillus sp. 11B TaxID=3060965 RepID=UPI00264D4804|nr:hypothetical protein [Paenibacillus sp. 11B]MDN8591780.1 hypothetical protein [Paenibacillus sp. 11B]
MTESFYDLLGRLRGSKPFFNKDRLLRCPFSGRDGGLTSLDIAFLRSLGTIGLLRFVSTEFSANGGMMPT